MRRLNQPFEIFFSSRVEGTMTAIWTGSVLVFSSGGVISAMQILYDKIFK
jgi:hypothetical protein